MIKKTYPITEKLLAKGIALSQKLFDLLSQEAEMLKNRASPDALSQLAMIKKETVVQLEQFSAQMAQIVATEGQSLTDAGIDQYFSKAHSAGLQISETAKQWRQICDIALQCRTLNEQNGAAIDLLLRHNHRVLQILRGKSQLATTYGPDGSTRTERFSQPLISV